MHDNFELKKAYHAKQAAYDEMAEAREKMEKLSVHQAEKYQQVNELQATYEEAKAEQDRAWESYNAEQLRYKDQIAQKITGIKECNILEENFSMMAKDEEDPAKAEIYRDGAKFFSSLVKQKMIDRDNLITIKRTAPRPDNSKTERILAQLKNERDLQAEVLEQYHQAKNEFSLKKQAFDRLNAKYESLRDPENTDPTNTYTSRPQRLDTDESLLLKAGVPEEYWDNCCFSQRVDGKIDIYFGAKVGTTHGHVVVDKDNVIYLRRPVSTVAPAE